MRSSLKRELETSIKKEKQRQKEKKETAIRSPRYTGGSTSAEDEASHLSQFFSYGRAFILFPVSGSDRERERKRTRQATEWPLCCPCSAPVMGSRTAERRVGSGALWNSGPEPLRAPVSQSRSITPFLWPHRAKRPEMPFNWPVSADAGLLGGLTVTQTELTILSHMHTHNAVYGQSKEIE